MGHSHLLSAVDNLDKHAALVQLQLYYYHLTVTLCNLCYCKKRWCSDYSQAGVGATCVSIACHESVSIPKTDTHRHICRNICTLWKTAEGISGIHHYTWLCKDYNCDPCHRCCRHGTFAMCQESILPLLHECSDSKQFWLKRPHFNLQLGLSHHPCSTKMHSNGYK